MEYNLLNDYPKPEKFRVVGKDIRTIKHRLVASKRDKDFFDGDRNYGYGGFIYDGRWQVVAKKYLKNTWSQKIVIFYKLIVKKVF